MEAEVKKLARTFQMKCPCKTNKCHLGIFVIVPRPSEIETELSNVQKKFYLGHGIKLLDPVEAAKIFLARDHKGGFHLHLLVYPFDYLFFTKMNINYYTLESY